MGKCKFCSVPCGNPHCFTRRKNEDTSKPKDAQPDQDTMQEPIKNDPDPKDQGRGGGNLT